MPDSLNVADYFSAQASQNPDRIAFVDAKGLEISFGHLQEKVDYTVAFLHSKGLKKGMKVLVLEPMTVDLYRIVLALFRMGVTAVFLDSWSGIKRLEECCNQLECHAIIGGWKLRMLRLFSSSLRAIPQFYTAKKSLLKTKGEVFELPITDASDEALITFTTGSTGIPKGAIRTHGFLAEQFRVLGEIIERKEPEVDLTTLPIVLLLNLGLGNTSVLPNFTVKRAEDFKPERLYNQLKKWKVERLSCSPFYAVQLAEYLQVGGEKLPDLKRIITGGAILYDTEVDRIRSVFHSISVQLLYGSTEAEPISIRNLETPDKVLNPTLPFGISVGTLHPGLAFGLLHLNEERTELEPAEWEAIQCKEASLGEIVVAGAHVLDKYIGGIEVVQKQKISVGKTLWHRTGDAGFLYRGELYLSGRCQEFIDSEFTEKGPFYYENELLKLPGVAKACSLLWQGNRVGVIEMKKGFSFELKEEFTKSFPEFQYWIEVDQMPIDPRHFSKIDYSKLREQMKILKGKKSE